MYLHTLNVSKIGQKLSMEPVSSTTRYVFPAPVKFPQTESKCPNIGRDITARVGLYKCMQNSAAFPFSDFGGSIVLPDIGSYAILAEQD